jgi:hypothetical protein
MRNAGAPLLTVINDILDLSKIEAEKMVIEGVDTPLVGVRLVRRARRVLAQPPARGWPRGVCNATRLPSESSNSATHPSSPIEVLG